MGQHHLKSPIVLIFIGLTIAACDTLDISEVLTKSETEYNPQTLEMRIQSQSPRLLDNHELCVQSLKAASFPFWDDHPSAQSFIGEARKRGFSPETCMEILNPGSSKTDSVGAAREPGNESVTN